MILITGANGVVGAPLQQRLKQLAKADFISVSRQASSQDLRSNRLQWDLHDSLSSQQLAQIGSLTSLIHTAPIWLLPKHIDVLASTGLQRVVAFSSTSVLSKRASPDPQEQQLVENLRNAEQQLAQQCARHEIGLTLLRPSMVYGYGRDQNISHIAAFIRRWRCMFLVGKASGKRQPVHADDLVDACLTVLDEPNTVGKAYNLAGRDVLSYRQMVHAIFAGLNIKLRIISIPLILFRSALRMAATVGRFAYTAEMANRMNQDLVYSYAAAKVDFGFTPQGFLQHPERDLVIHDDQS